MSETTAEFDWDRHCGTQQSPREFVEQLAGNETVEQAVRWYLAKVRAGEVFGEKVPLDEYAEADMLNYIVEDLQWHAGDEGEDNVEELRKRLFANKE